jgi:hypothetical protein
MAVDPEARREGDRRVMAWTLGVLGVVCALAIGGCVALLFVVDEAADVARQGIDALDAEAGRFVDGHAISDHEFAGLSRLDDRDLIERRLGPPIADSMVPSGRGEELPQGARECAYYFRKGQSVLDGPSFRLCYRDGRLLVKKRY